MDKVIQPMTEIYDIKSLVEASRAPSVYQNGKSQKNTVSLEESLRIAPSSDK